MAQCARDYYLNTLGVVQYVPREYDLPGIESTAPAPVAEPPIGRPTPPPAELKALTEPTAPVAKSEPAPAPSASSAAAVVEPVAADQVRLRICYWQLADLLVFDSLDYGQNPPQDCHQLLSNILQAVGRLTAPLAEPELMDWPLVPNAPASAEGARAMFATFLGTRVKQSGANWVLVMGNRARDYLLTEAPAASGQRSLTDGCQAIVTPGLAEMLAEPERKRTTWDAIRCLLDQPGG